MANSKPFIRDNNGVGVRRYSGLGVIAAFAFVLVIGTVSIANRSMNYTAVKATVDTIDRTCKFTESTRTTTPDGRDSVELKSVTDSCNSTDEFKKIANSSKRKKVVDGKAVVHVSYSSPKDGSWHTGDLQFDGRDEQFYKLKAGDQVDILVSNDDPTKIIAD